MFIESLGPGRLDQVRDPNSRAIMIATEIKSRSIGNLANLTSNLATEVYAEDPGRSPMGFYRRYAELVDFRIPRMVSDGLVAQAKSDDPEVAAEGKNTLLYLRMTSAVALVDAFSTGDENAKWEALHAGFDHYFQGISSYQMTYESRPVVDLVGAGVIRFVAQREGMPLDWVRTGKHIKIKEMVSLGIQATSSYDDLISKISDTFRESREDVERYVDGLIAQRNVPIESDGVEIMIPESLLAERADVIDRAMQDLNPREISIINARFRLNGAEFMSFEELSREFDITRERVRQIYTKALRKLKRPIRSQSLSIFLKDEVHEDTDLPKVPETSERIRELQLERIRARRMAALKTIGLRGTETHTETGQIYLEELLSSRPMEERTWDTVGVAPDSWRGATGVKMSGLIDADLEDESSRVKLFEFMEKSQWGIDQGRILIHLRDRGIIDEFSRYLKEKYSGSYYYRDNRFVREKVEVVVDDQLSLGEVQRVYLKLLSKGFNPTVITSLRNALDLVSPSTLAQIQEKVVSGQR